MANSFLSPKLKEGESVDLSLFSPRERTNIRLYGLDCKHWTPTDVYKFKRDWMVKSTEVKLKTKLDVATRWCRHHLFQQDYDIKKNYYSDGTHAVFFKNAEDAFFFRLSFT